MLRAFLVLIAGIFLGWAGHQPALAQLRTLSPGNAEAQWRDAQVSLFDQQLAQPQLPPELAAELVAQRTWLSAWTPKQSSSTASVPAAPVPEAQAEAATKPTALRQEPILDPNQLATPYRQALLASQSGPTAEDTAALQLALEKHSGDLGLRRDRWHGQALQLLEMNKERLDPSAYLAEKVALLDALAWEVPAKQAKSALEAFPVTERYRLEIRWME